MRSASLCAYSAEKLFLIEQCRSVCGRSGIAFSRVEKLPQSKPDVFASSLWEGAFGMVVQFSAKVQSLRERTLPRGELSRSD